MPAFREKDGVIYRAKRPRVRMSEVTILSQISFSTPGDESHESLVSLILWFSFGNLRSEARLAPPPLLK